MILNKGSSYVLLIQGLQPIYWLQFGMKRQTFVTGFYKPLDDQPWFLLAPFTPTGLYIHTHVTLHQHPRAHPPPPFQTTYYMQNLIQSSHMAVTSEQC